jgi:hypothetical protein
MPTFMAVWPFNYNTGGEPPQSSQIRFDVTTDPTGVTKMWVRSPTNDNRDVSTLLLNILPGSRLYLQNRADSTNYVVLDTTGPPIDKTTYAELPVAFISGSMVNGAIDLYAPVTLGVPDPVPVTGSGTPGELAAWTAPTAIGDSGEQAATPPPATAPVYVTLQQAADHLLLPIDVTQDPPDARLRDVQQKLAAATAIILDYLKIPPPLTVNPLNGGTRIYNPDPSPPPVDPVIQQAILIQLGELWGIRGDDESGALMHSRGTTDPGLMSQLSPTITNLLRRKRDPALA